MAEVDAQFLDDRQIPVGFDAFGDDPCAGALGQFVDRPEEMKLQGIRTDPLDEVLVHLDEFGMQFGPEPEAGEALPEIVQGDGEAQGAEEFRGLQEGAIVEGRLAFGELNDDIAWQQAKLFRQVGSTGGPSFGVQQGTGAEVDEDPMVLGCLGPGSKDRLDAGPFQLREHPAFAGGAQEIQGSVEHRITGPPDQPLEAVQISDLEIHDGLEMGCQGLPVENAPEFHQEGVRFQQQTTGSGSVLVHGFPIQEMVRKKE